MTNDITDRAREVFNTLKTEEDVQLFKILNKSTDDNKPANLKGN